MRHTSSLIGTPKVGSMKEFRNVNKSSRFCLQKEKWLKIRKNITAFQSIIHRNSYEGLIFYKEKSEDHCTKPASTKCLQHAPKTRMRPQYNCIWEINYEVDNHCNHYKYHSSTNKKEREG